MAILFGTTAEGETLPVEVNEFGQLIAQGLPGQAGPPGPPGLPELPPDPFEGAVLGWKDNTLAWLGGSVPLPPGTYGPILAYAEGVLTLETPVDLPYLTAFFLSDELGAQYFFQITTSAITDVSPGNPGWLQQQTYSTKVGNAGNPPLPTNTINIFDGDLTTSFDAVRPAQAFYSNPSSSIDLYTIQTFEVYGSFPDIDEFQINSGKFKDQVSGALDWYSIDGLQGQQFARFIWGGTVSGGALVYAIRLNGLLLVDASIVRTTLTLESSTGLSEFAVGDLVQSNDVFVKSIDPAGPYLTTDGGTWTVGQPVTGPFKSGAGTVQTTVGDTIVLREDNELWKVDKYVTVPEQNLAARYVYGEEIRKKVL